jgi:hypothetical protein
MKSTASFPWDSYFNLIEQNIQSEPEIDKVIKVCEKYSGNDFKEILKINSNKTKKNYCLHILKNIKKSYNDIMENSKLNQSLKKVLWDKKKMEFKGETIVEDEVDEDENKSQIKFIKKYLKDKNWNEDSQYSNDEEMNEYLLSKLLDEEKDLTKDEKEYNLNITKLKNQKQQIEEEMNEQNELIKELKSLKKKDKKAIEKTNSEYDLLNKKLNYTIESIKYIENNLKNIENSRKERRQICYKLDYDEDIIDKAMAIDDLKCEDKSQVCNLDSHICQDRDPDHPVYAGKLGIPLIPVDKAIELENKLELQSFKSNYTAPSTPGKKGPRFVSMQTPEVNITSDVESEVESEDELEELNTQTEKDLDNVFEGEEHPLMSDDEVECFSEDEYATTEDLEESLDCGEEQICDISKKKCIDYPEDDSYMNKVGDTEYTFSSLTNVDIMNKIKNKFKHAIVTPLKSDSTDIPQVDVPVIDMEVPPAHISERVDLTKFQDLVKIIRTKPRLSVDSKFDDRTKARRNMIRECLNL